MTSRPLVRLSVAWTLAAALLVVPAAPGTAATAAVRVNAGGPELAGTPVWGADTQASPSPYVNAAATGNKTFTTTHGIDMTDPSIPPGTPAAMFQTERWDPPGGAELEWHIPVTAGS
jgi:hypothetical protein